MSFGVIVPPKATLFVDGVKIGNINSIAVDDEAIEASLEKLMG